MAEGAPMLRITIELRGSGEDAQGIKERLAMDLERYGDVRVVDVREINGHQQMTMEV